MLTPWVMCPDGGRRPDKGVHTRGAEYGAEPSRIVIVERQHSFHRGPPMTRVTLASATLAAVVTLATTGCAANPGGSRPSTESPPPVAAAPGSPDMTSHAGHDMRSSGDQKNAELSFLFPDGNDKGWSKVENGTQHHVPAAVPIALLPAATRAELLRQLALTMEVSRKFPTVKDAEAAGYKRAGPFLPGLGTHYVGGRTNRTGTLTDADILEPSTIIYHGTRAESPIAGFMYMATATPGSAQPEGFAGPNDHWHYHTGICLTAGANGAMEALGFDGSITEESCRTKGGNFVAMTQYLLHVWTVPGYSSPLGVFSHTNPALTCGDGTYHTDERDITNACRVK
jgi:hypothetical protein